ncbi:hypothetical protein DPMN_053314 [Dreissena polymorpha]|uniref:Uncharacterized protein n=1 Tax=Dreissena polymorpha TaxID=45954 RepID=A0A9D4CL49_DREPO|nr:hypothetical protein DPMN_053314 [Dreissena polymorpha]
MNNFPMMAYVIMSSTRIVERACEISLTSPAPIDQKLQYLAEGLRGVRDIPDIDITIADDVPGTFKLEIDYIAVVRDDNFRGKSDFDMELNSFKLTAQTQMRRRIMRRLIWVYAVCQGLFSRRYTMDAHTLQYILRSKYNINEKLQVMGIFVVLQGGTMKANGLFRIGIGERFVVVSGINPRGPEIDYNPVSLTPSAQRQEFLSVMQQ